MRQDDILSHLFQLNCLSTFLYAGQYLKVQPLGEEPDKQHTERHLHHYAGPGGTSVIHVVAIQAY